MHFRNLHLLLNSLINIIGMNETLNIIWFLPLHQCVFSTTCIYSVLSPSSVKKLPRQITQVGFKKK